MTMVERYIINNSMITCMVTEDSRLSVGEHIIRYINVESLCCIPETNIVLFGNYNKKTFQVLETLFKDTFLETLFCTHVENFLTPPERAWVAGRHLSFTYIECFSERQKVTLSQWVIPGYSWHSLL